CTQQPEQFFHDIAPLTPVSLVGPQPGYDTTGRQRPRTCSNYRFRHCVRSPRSIQRIAFRVVAEIQPDGLQFRVLVVGMNRVVAATKTRQFEAAERRGDVALAETVDGDRAGT